jgi:hypothetical protein
MTDAAETAHTAGPLTADAHFAVREGGRTYIPVLRPGNDPVPLALVHRDVDGYGKGEGEANARLIIDAFNVATETGLTPRQLAEQRANMLAALKELVKKFERCAWAHGNTRSVIDIAVKPYLDVIAKAEGRAP